MFVLVLAAKRFLHKTLGYEDGEPRIPLSGKIENEEFSRGGKSPGTCFTACKAGRAAPGSIDGQRAHGESGGRSFDSVRHSHIEEFINTVAGQALEVMEFRDVNTVFDQSR